MTPTQGLPYSAAAIKNSTSRMIAALSIRRRKEKKMVWIVEVKTDPGRWIPLLGYVFESKEGAERTFGEVREISRGKGCRAMPYHQISREDLEWAICHLGMYAHSEELERIKGAVG